MDNNSMNLQGALHSSVQSMNEKVAHAGAPVYRLSECLALHTRTRLGELAKVLSIPKTSKMKKDELISEIASKLTDTEMLASILAEADEKEFEIFTTAVNKGAVKFGSGEIMPFQALHFLGVAAAFLSPGLITVIIPDEIKDTWYKLEKTGFSEEKLRDEMIHKYAAAAVNMYGAISLEAFMVLLGRFETVLFDEDSVKASILAHVSRNQPYYLWDNYVVNALFGDNVEGLEKLLDMAEDIPRYVPQKDAFLRFAAPVYFDDTPAIGAVAQLLTGVIGDSHLAEVLIGDLRIMFASGITEEEGYRMLVSSGVNFRDQETTQTAIALLKNMRREMRLWAKRGHTKEEADQIGTIGRNDKCKCESGLKYKKCCAGK